MGLDPYSFALFGPPHTPKERLRRTWHWQLARAMKSLIHYRLKILRLPQSATEGNSDALEVEHFSGRLSELMRWRQVYEQRLREVLDTGYPRSGWDRRSLGLSPPGSGDPIPGRRGTERPRMSAGRTGHCKRGGDPHGPDTRS